jgi:nicotinate-nucleotide pyrophosphorylase
MGSHAQRTNPIWRSAKNEVKKVEVEVRRMQEVEALAKNTAEIEYSSARNELEQRA